MRAAANALSVSRALLAAPLVVALHSGATALALAVLAAAIASDVLDGLLARRSGRSWRTPAPTSGASGDGRSPLETVGDALGGRGRPLGACLDVGADAVFLLSGLTVLWVLGQVPVWLPIVAAAMLARFFATSPRSTGPRYDPIGRHYGTLLYGVLAVWLLGAPAPVRQAALVLVAVVTAVALVGRTRFLRGVGSGRDAGGEAMGRAKVRLHEKRGAA